jgi:hypothetical protein
MILVRLSNTIGRLTVLMFGVLAITSLSISSISANHTTDGRRLFGIKLHRTTQGLLENVERGLGKRIKEEVISTWEATYRGESEILDDGTPVIRLNRAFSKSEQIILHELFHLKLKIEGFYTIEFEGESLLLQRQQGYLRWIKILLYDGLEHRLYYPRIRAFGFDPSADFFRDFKERRRTNSLATLGRDGTDDRALYFFKAVLELNSKEIDEVENWFKAKNWTVELEMGKRLAKLVTSEDPRTPDHVMNTFVRCLNELLLGKARFIFSQSETRILGIFSQKVAVIKFEEYR